MKCKKRGFTLVELTVVLAILAVLAGLLLPSLTSYIDKAKKAKNLANAKGFLNAAQTVCSELYALDRQALCNGGNDHNSCNVIIPLKNYGVGDPPGPEYDGTYGKYKRYRETYNLYSDYLKRNSGNTQFEVIAAVKDGKVISVRYREKDSDIILEWNENGGTWTELNASQHYAWAGEMFEKLNYPLSDVNWNGRNSRGNID